MEDREGRKGSEATRVGSRQISKQHQLLSLIVEFQRRFATICSKPYITRSRERRARRFTRSPKANKPMAAPEATRVAPYLA